MTKRMISLMLLYSIAVGNFGCASEDETPTATVSGEVQWNGEPFTGAAVRFYSPELGGGAFNLDADGKFESPNPLVVGEYLVSLDRPGPTPGVTPSDQSWPENHVGKLPARYRSGSESGLTAEVTEDGENHFLFQLEGSPSASDGSRSKGPQVIQPINEESS